MKSADFHVTGFGAALTRIPSIPVRMEKEQKTNEKPIRSKRREDTRSATGIFSSRFQQASHVEGPIKDQTGKSRGLIGEFACADVDPPLPLTF